MRSMLPLVVLIRKLFLLLTSFLGGRRTLVDYIQYGEIINFVNDLGKSGSFPGFRYWLVGIGCTCDKEKKLLRKLIKRKLWNETGFLNLFYQLAL